MKNIHYFLLFVFFTLSILSFSACKKEKLTKATQIGANTFSCRIDGSIFKPSDKGGLFGGEPLIVSNLPIDGFLVLATKYGNNLSPHTSVLIRLPFLKTNGTYELYVYPYGEFSKEFSNPYRTNTIHTGIVNITRCDTVNHIYSGTFSFTAVDDSTGKMVKITDGRFDVKR